MTSHSSKWEFCNNKNWRSENFKICVTSFVDVPLWITIGKFHRLSPGSRRRWQGCERPRIWFWRGTRGSAQPRRSVGGCPRWPWGCRNVQPVEPQDSGRWNCKKKIWYILNQRWTIEISWRAKKSLYVPMGQNDRFLPILMVHLSRKHFGLSGSN